MTRAELVAEVRRLADETANLAAEVRRGDVAVGLLGQVRDFGHRLPPGLAADIRRVVDDMVATRHEAHGEPSCSPRSGTSSAGGSGQRPPAAPSTETRQAAQDGQSGSGGDAMDGVPAHQPTPQVGESPGGRERVKLIGIDRVDERRWEVVFPGASSTSYRNITSWRLVERDGRPYPPAQEPEPVAVEPATDEDIERWLSGMSEHRLDSMHHALVARVQQDDREIRGKYQIIDALIADRDEAVARAERAERLVGKSWKEDVAGVERVTAAERAVVEAARVHVEGIGVPGGWNDLCDAVRALRDAQEAQP